MALLFRWNYPSALVMIGLPSSPTCSPDFCYFSFCAIAVRREAQKAKHKNSSFKIWTFSAFLYVSEKTRTNFFLVFLTVLAGKKPSNMIAGWDFYFLKVLLASSEERVFFSQES